MLNDNVLAHGGRLTFPGLRHHQIAYVTNDLDRALRQFSESMGLERYYLIDTQQEPSHPGQPALKIALVRSAGTEFEIIQPLGYNDAVWSSALPADGSFTLKFHHLGVTVDGPVEEFERYRATWDAQHHPIVVDGWAGDMARWFYTDERATLGHYLEHCWFSDELKAHMAGAVPTCPKAP